MIEAQSDSWRVMTVDGLRQDLRPEIIILEIFGVEILIIGHMWLASFRPHYS